MCLLALYLALAGIFTPAILAPVEHNNDAVGKLQFTSKISNLEIVFYNQYVQLNCFAKNFQAVKWLKDDIPYPEWNYLLWLGGWVELRNSNQSLVIARTPYEAAGTYRCVVSDATSKISHDIKLRVDELPWNGRPLALHSHQCTNKSAARGDDITFYCEYYIGSNNFFAFVDWAIVADDGTLTPIYRAGRSDLRTETRRYDDVLGSFLHVSNVTDTAFGQYTVTAMNGAKSASVTLELYPHPNSACPGSTEAATQPE